jgi:hypothetical protein
VPRSAPAEVQGTGAPGAQGAGDDPVAALCQAHGYPAEVEAILRRVLQALAPLHPRSVLLHGSAARGELTWWREPQGGVSLGSDLEMCVVLDAPLGAQAGAQLQARVRQVEREVSGGPAALFHVDLEYDTPAGLGGRPRTFRTWDTRATGWTLAGEDLRAALPALDAATIDLRQLNEVPIHRLWEMAFRAPAALLEGTAAEAQADAFRMVCARQALDLTTWLLPHFGVMVPTFRRRVEVWERQLDALPLGRYFPPRSGAFLGECLRGKLHREFTLPPAALHAEVLDHFRAALRLLLGLEPGAGDEAVAAAALRQGPAHWNVEPPRRRGYEAYLLLRDRELVRPLRAFRWWMRPKRPHQVAFLLHLNAALQALLAGGDAAPALDRADRLLAELWYGFRPAPGTARARFLAARRGYVDYLVGTSRWFAPRREYLYSVLGEAGPA